METLPVCQQCNEGSYKYAEGGNIICVRCGAVYTEYGTAKRSEGRLNVKAACTISHKERESHLEAMVVDVSLHGARIRYQGEPLSETTLLHLDVDGLALHTPAKIMWSHSEGDDHYIGVRLIWPPQAICSIG